MPFKNPEETIREITEELNLPGGDKKQAYDKLKKISKIVNLYYGEKKAILFLGPTAEIMPYFPIDLTSLDKPNGELFKDLDEDYWEDRRLLRLDPYSYLFAATFVFFRRWIKKTKQKLCKTQRSKFYPTK